MAAPHAAGLAALLVSGLAEEKRPIQASVIKQALMVTARPLPGATLIDEGTGIPDLDQAYTWLRGDRSVPEIAVRALGAEGWTTAGFRERRTSDSTWVQRFELIRPPSVPKAVYTLRSDVPWASAPPRLTFSGSTTTVDIRYHLSGLKPPGAYVGTVTGWGSDTLVGPIFRLVSTVVAPEPVASGTHELRSSIRVEPGTQVRTFFRADSARPLELRLSSGGRGQRGLAFLHEPDGMPYRDESARPIGSADREAVYQIDGRDVVAGAYETVAVAPSTQPLTFNVKVIQSPLLLRLDRDTSGAVASLSNVSSAPVTTQVGVLLGGGERVETVVARGSAERRIPFVAPAWARAVVVDLSMERAQWSRFTDFGVTLFDSVGRQIEKKPLNYAFGRLQAKLPDGHGDMRLTLGLFPGFADPRGDEAWRVRASIRLYADSGVALDGGGQPDSTVTIAPGKTASVRYSLPSSPWPLGDGFFPLAVLVARADERTWTREAGLAPPNPAIMR
jgi:hypothetical protein